MFMFNKSKHAKQPNFVNEVSTTGGENDSETTMTTSDKKIDRKIERQDNITNLSEPNQNGDDFIKRKRGLLFDHETDSSTGSSEHTPFVTLGRKSSLSRTLRKTHFKKKRGIFSNKRTVFNCIAFVLPSFLVMWYAAAILLPPGVREKYDLLIWDDGLLTIGDDGELSLCPVDRPSICSEGMVQLMALAMARLSAFASYVFLSASFFTKMHFLNHFLASTYLRKFIPYECLHHIHKKSAKMFGGLIMMHTVSHYMRYIARSDTDQLTTKIHVSGLIGFISILTMIIGMSSIIKRYNCCKFETRFNLHWIAMFILFVALCIHHWRVRLIVLIHMILWSMDYLYGTIFATYNLEVVELLPLPNKGGVQMLWRNSCGFRPRSGEYVKIQLPWLSEGGDEWHPFSIYLKESTERGFKSVHNLANSNRRLFGGRDFMDEEAVSILSLKEFMRSTLIDEFDPIDSSRHSLVEKEAREDILEKYDTTQVFIYPIGDWTKNLMKELENQRQLRACWVRGPYTSPFFVAQNFSHIVLTATGIGITPALGVMGQYPGFSRTKILVWSTRDKNMLKFFAPLINDAHLAVIYYTGKEKLSNKEVLNISSHGNIYIQQSRPSSFHETVESVIVEFENHINLSAAETIQDIELVRKAAWCVLYCGGSRDIKDELKQFSKKSGAGFEAELFNW